MLLGALEAGGTKMVCALGDDTGKIYEQISIPTETPDITIPRITEYFKDKQIEALGIGCFGPIELNRNSKKYGYITSTPKLAWIDCDIVGRIKKELNIPIGFDTDVNGSLLGEVTYGQAQGLTSAIYITIGTGIGIGVMAEGKLLHGMLHPEGGHITMVPHPDDNYKGKCPYHRTCFEGMASGPAIEERYGVKAQELSENDSVWMLEAYYIAQAVWNYILTLSPQKIILGGGVMHQKKLFPMIRSQVDKYNNGYINTKEMSSLDNYIVPASLNDDQGIMGALRLGFNEKFMKK